MTLPRNPQAVVFDMDGLLFDTEAIYREAMIATALRLGFEMSDQVFLAMVGLPPEASRAHLRDHYGHDFDVETFWIESANDFHKLSTGRQFLKAGVLELLAALDRSDLRRAIATSSRHLDVQRHLTAHDLQSRFHCVVAQGDYVLGKPNPDPFLKAAERLGVAPENCLALEDSFNGVRSAAAAGMMTVMVPDLILPSDEIRRLCLRVAGDLHEVRELLLTTTSPLDRT
ncbi:HAD family phosphatase [Bradyrhizobium sp. LHD-71]|uniref:HAD family hydrolase n=1 Tax=Bradyrhizobium sp. LHD-71 TaxID=3072141 RepID=UPI00280C9DE9|nr:HAD family phosphatase [Bradyrhizobium sp. LHD-71]MDQ8728594.1 HAD family phosphatase [Bradyrhizobium sp. LHD-71]